MTLTKEIINPYINQGLRLREIAEKFNTNPSTISKIKNGKIKKYRVGIKSQHADKEYVKIWEIIPADIFLSTLKKESKYLSCQRQDWYFDFFMDYWTTRLEEHQVIKKLKQAKYKLAYFKTVTQHLVFSHAFKKTRAYKKTRELENSCLEFI